MNHKNVIAVITEDVSFALISVFDERIEYYSGLLMKEDSIDQIRRYQGAIQELQALKKLRDRSLQVLKGS